MKLVVEISAGELVDKITILEIKLENISDEAKRANIGREYAALVEALDAAIAQSGVAVATAFLTGADSGITRSRHLRRELSVLRGALKAVNADLWRIEDEIRDQERAGAFGAEFVALARSVYRTNDRRAALKREINELLGSQLIEEKSYSAY
jgi:hypothetical protein